MKWVAQVMRRLGYVPVGAAQASAAAMVRTFQRQRRGYDAGAQSRLTLDFSGSMVSIDSDLVRQLRVMRGRSRQLVKNEPYARRYSRLVEKNVSGCSGVQLSVLGREGAESGFRLSKQEAEAIEKRWRQWAGSSWVSTDRRSTWIQVQRAALRNGCTDGEIFLRLVPNLSNPFLLSLEWLVPEQFDEQHNGSAANGSEIRMAIEFDAAGQRTAYHAYRRNPDDFLVGSQRVGRGERTRIPAEEMVHWYLQDFIGQTRGVPWLFSAIPRVNMLGGYEEAELVAARVSAAKMGFIIPPAGQEYEGDGTDEGGNTVVDAQPGTFETLSAGSEIKSFDPQHPNANFGSFSKCMLRGIAMAGDVSYHTLTGDLESVNYSSARVGLLDERDGYTVLQDEFIRGFCEPVFRAWLMAQSVLGAIPLSIEEARTFDEVIWRARRWSWVDPQKEIGAAAQAVALRVRSRTQIVAEQGGEVGQTFKELSAEEQALEALDLATDVPAEPAPAVSGKQEQDDEDDEDDDSGEPEAPQRNGHLKPERFSRG